MLNIIRDNVQSLGVKFVVAVVAVVMLTFGLSTYRSQGVNTVAEVDGYEIKLDAYQRAYERAESQYRKQYRENAERFIEAFRLKEQVVGQLVDNAVLLKNARANGLEVSDLEVANAIYENPAFRTDNRFDQKKYDKLLKNYRTNKIVYERELRDSILTGKYLRFLHSGVSFSREYVKEEYRRFHTEMDIKMIELTPSLFADRVKVTEDRIGKYYESHRTDFEQKKQFVIDYIALSVDDVKSKVVVREKEIKGYYDRHKDREFAVRESYDSRHILVAVGEGREAEDYEKAKKEADRLYGELVKDRERFAELAARHSADPGSRDRGGNLGWVDKGTFVQSYEDAVGSLSRGEISKPVKSQFGYHIIELIDKKEATVKSLEEVKERVSELVRLGKAKRRLAGMAAKLLRVEEGENRPSMQELAESAQKTAKQTVPFDDGQNLEVLGHSYGLYSALSSRSLGDRGSFELASGEGILVYEISKIVDPYVKPLEVVKSQVRIFARQEAEKEFAERKGREFEKSIKTGEQFDELEPLLKTKAVSARFTLADGDSEAGNVDFRMEVFNMAAGEVKLIARDRNNVLVFMVGKEVPETIEEDDLRALETRLQEQKARILLSGIIANTRRETDIQFNKAMLSALQIEPVS